MKPVMVATRWESVEEEAEAESSESVEGVILVT